MTNEMKWRDRVAAPDDRSRVFDALAVGQGWMFLSVQVDADGDFGMKLETGGLIQEIDDIRTLLGKLLESLPGAEDTKPVLPHLVEPDGDLWIPTADGMYRHAQGTVWSRERLERSCGPLRALTPEQVAGMDETVGLMYLLDREDDLWVPLGTSGLYRLKRGNNVASGNTRTRQYVEELYGPVRELTEEEVANL